MSEIPTANPEFVSYLQQQIEAAGGLTFACFMGECLYNKRYGYYQSNQIRVGRQGDFFTSSSVHQLFGNLLGRQIAELVTLLDEPLFTLVEQGPGEGHLANDILTSLQREAPAAYARIRYLLVEQNLVARQRQEKLLTQHSERVSWVTEDELEPFCGCLLSNELVDAFPVHLVEKQAAGLREVFVVNAADGFAEELREPSSGELQAHLDWLGCSPVTGNRAELNLEAVRWLTRMANRLQRGFILTIDYGYPAAELFALHRRLGTLLCYAGHTTNEKPLQAVGEQDITAHVDFTALQKAGDEAGLSNLWFGEQYRFLLALGFVEELMVLQAREQNPAKARELRLKLKNLIMPEGGMGDTFKVLLQSRGVDQPVLACMRNLADIPLPQMPG